MMIIDSTQRRLIYQGYRNIVLKRDLNRARIEYKVPAPGGGRRVKYSETLAENLNVKVKPKKLP